MKVEKKDNLTAVVVPAGKIDVTNSNLFKEKLTQLCDEGFKDIIIDFTNVNALDSSGIGKLLVFYKKLKDKGGTLSIINIKHENVRNLLDMICLDKVINIVWN
ncbi:MAG: STAS domain-containing protein [Firmicutes bacterium]|nr:STAS domain-containing protein [Bacillota bacterium]